MSSSELVPLSMNKKIKILFAINCMNIGGAPSVVLHQLRSLDQNIFEPHVLTLYPSKQHNFFSELSFLQDSQIHSFHLRNRSVFDLKTICQIFRLLRKERFDIVYTHLFLANFLVRVCAVFARIPVIISFEHSIYAQKRLWQVWADRVLSWWTQCVIVSTESVAEFTKMQQHLSSQKIVVIPNPITVPHKVSVGINSLHDEFCIPRDKKIVLHIGRFSEEKGHRVLIDAVSYVMQNNPHVHFVLVGHGALEHEIREYIRSQNLEDHITLVVEPRRAKEFLHIAHLFVLPSLREGQGIVIYEAMMAGVPVLVSDLPPIRAIITDKENGFLFKTGDSKALSDALLSCIDNQELLSIIAHNGRETMHAYQEENKNNRISQLFLDLYNTHVART